MGVKCEKKDDIVVIVAFFSCIKSSIPCIVCTYCQENNVGVVNVVVHWVFSKS